MRGRVGLAGQRAGVMDWVMVVGVDGLGGGSVTLTLGHGTFLQRRTQVVEVAARHALDLAILADEPRGVAN